MSRGAWTVVKSSHFIAFTLTLVLAIAFGVCVQSCVVPTPSPPPSPLVTPTPVPWKAGDEAVLVWGDGISGEFAIGYGVPEGSPPPYPPTAEKALRVWRLPPGWQCVVGTTEHIQGVDWVLCKGRLYAIDGSSQIVTVWLQSKQLARR